MSTRFEAVEFSDIIDKVRAQVTTFSSPIDSFLEGHIVASNHYRVTIDGQYAGFASIHGESLITQFALTGAYRARGQVVFAQLRHMENVQSAFVPTSDEFFLAHALDDYRQLAKQACFFRSTATDRPPIPANHGTLQLATAGDASLVREFTGEFFGDIERLIEQHALFVIQRNNDVVGFGVIETSVLYEDIASIGMFTAELHRHRGVGTTTIGLLIEECARRGVQPIAGCWYYNHASKRTLERAGMFSPTRLLKIDY
jgi:RimJ/RimL family protein N-acetyltransferase